MKHIDRLDGGRVARVFNPKPFGDQTRRSFILVDLEEFRDGTCLRGSKQTLSEFYFT